MVGPAAKREVVAHLCNALQMSERRACNLIAADRKMIRYRSRRSPDLDPRARLRDLANQRRRFGYRRLFILLREQGEPSGVNRIYRLYREEQLTVRKRKARRRAVGTRTPILVEAKVNARWSLDFVHDQFALGRRFRSLNIVDDVTRECLAATPDTSISGKQLRASSWRSSLCLEPSSIGRWVLFGHSERVAMGAPRERCGEATHASKMAKPASAALYDAKLSCTQ